MEKITQKELREVRKKQVELQKKYYDWRKGQCFFNALHMLFPDIANSIRRTKYDPFHTNKSSSVETTITFILKEKNENI